MFLSGVTKLLSGDVTWHELTALNIHYQTQPLPTTPGWYAHHLPSWVHGGSVAIMFFIEIAVPLCIVCPRLVRHAGCALLVLLQILIGLTGNYCFFNLLTIILCLPLLDDRLLARLRIPGTASAPLPPPRAGPPGAAPLIVAGAAGIIAVLSMLASMAEMVRTVELQQRSIQAGASIEPIPSVVVDALDLSDKLLLSWGRPLIDGVRHLRSINGYGLFRNMTEKRPEIDIEVSVDRKRWVSCRFRWKPGPLDVRPGWVQPHQPRLDWQMWFAALNPQRQGHWLLPFARRVLEGSPPVLRLLAADPMPGARPRYVRFVFYEYRFTDMATRAESGRWWRRRARGHGQVISLDQLQRVR